MAAPSSEDHDTGNVRGYEPVRASLLEVSVQGDGEEAGEEVCLQTEEFLFEAVGAGAGVRDLFVGVCGVGGGEGAGERRIKPVKKDSQFLLLLSSSESSSAVFINSGGRRLRLFGGGGVCYLAFPLHPRHLRHRPSSPLTVAHHF
nr:POU domain, class 3, transcription factor 1-like [Ipomoea trifida]